MVLVKQVAIMLKTFFVLNLKMEIHRNKMVALMILLNLPLLMILQSLVFNLMELLGCRQVKLVKIVSFNNCLRIKKKRK